MKITLVMNHSIKLVTVTVLSLVMIGCTSYLGIGNTDEAYLQKKYLKTNSTFIEVDGLTIHYTIEGQGPPVVLLHGFMSSLHAWDAWAEILKHEYTVYRIDLPGSGFSYLPRADKDLYHESRFVPLMRKVFDRHGLKQAHFVGNSLGAFVAWNYALEYPQTVKSLTLIDSLTYSQDLPFLLRFATNSFVSPVARVMFPKPFMRIGLNHMYQDHSFVTPELVQRHYDLLLRKGNRFSTLEIMKQFKERSTDPQLGTSVRNLKMPTLIMWGEDDEWLPAEKVAKRLKGDIPHAQLIIYPNTGHLPMEEKPDQSANDFLEFLRGIHHR